MHLRLWSLLLISFATSLATTLSGQPANDDCSASIDLTVFTDFAFDTEGATTDGPLHPGQDCFTDGNDSIYADIWYRFTAIADGPLEFTTCNMADFDTRLAIYATTDACLADNENLVACNDDAPGCGDFSSMITFFGLEGQTYIFRLGSYTDANAPTTTGSGTVRLNVLAGPENDFCENAVEVGLGTNAFTNNFASTDGPEQEGTPCENEEEIRAQADVWYRFTAPYTGTAIWSTCGSADYDTGLAVYPANVCPPTPESLIACNDDTEGCDDFTSQLNFDIVAGESYLLRLGGYNGDMGTGTFSIFGIDVSTREPSAPVIEALFLYPNPAAERLNVEFQTKVAGPLHYSVTDRFGRRVMSEKISIVRLEKGSFSLVTDRLSSGVYYLSVTDVTGNGNSIRFVKQ